MFSSWDLKTSHLVSDPKTASSPMAPTGFCLVFFFYIEVPSEVPLSRTVQIGAWCKRHWDQYGMYVSYIKVFSEKLNLCAQEVSKMDHNLSTHSKLYHLCLLSYT